MIEKWSLEVKSASFGDPRNLEYPTYPEPPIKGQTRWQLTIMLNRDLMSNNPDIVLVCGNRIFHVIEDVQGDFDDGLFRERRINGDAHQPGI